MAYRKKLPRTFEKFEAGAAKLKEAVSQDFEKKYDRDVLVEIVIKRFEYTFESMWKTLKELMLEEGIECVSPLGCIKEAFKLGLIDEQDEEVFALMVRKRNEVVHVYSDEDAYEIYLLIKTSFAGAMFEVLSKVKAKLSL